jgi:hypothetical protein
VNSGLVQQLPMEEAEVVHDSTTVEDKRAARGLGPFTGRQLTVIIVTAMLVVGLPHTRASARPGIFKRPPWRRSVESPCEQASLREC